MEGLGGIGLDTTKRRVGLQSGRTIIQVGGAGVSPIRIGVLGPVGLIRENGGRDTHQVSETNHGEVGALDCGWDVYYTSGGRSAGSGGKSVRNNLHQRKPGGGDTVGGAAANIAQGRRYLR